MWRKLFTEYSARGSLTETAEARFPAMLVGYIRVSTADERQSTDPQRDTLRDAGVDERHVYEDRASGGRDDRPGLKACLEYLTGGDVLVVRRLDRLGRSLPHLVGIVAELRSRDVGLRSLSETIDTTTATGEPVFHLFASLARYERAPVRERVVAGLEAARRRGRRGGRPRRARARAGGGGEAMPAAGESPAAGG